MGGRDWTGPGAPGNRGAGSQTPLPEVGRQDRCEPTLLVRAPMGHHLESTHSRIQLLQISRGQLQSIKPKHWVLQSTFHTLPAPACAHMVNSRPRGHRCAGQAGTRVAKSVPCGQPCLGSWESSPSHRVLRPALAPGVWGCPWV